MTITKGGYFSVCQRNDRHLKEIFHSYIVSTVNYLDRSNLAFQNQAIGFLLIALVLWIPLGSTLIYYNLRVFILCIWPKAFFVKETCERKQR